MKYVVFESRGLGVATVFDSLIDHNGMVNQFAVVLGAGECSISATSNEIEVGSCIMNDIDVHCYGKSVTLNKSSRGDEDAKIIKKMLMRVS